MGVVGDRDWGSWRCGICLESIVDAEWAGAVCAVLSVIRLCLVSFGVGAVAVVAVNVCV